MEDMLQVVDSHRLLRVKDNQIVAIAFVVAEEEIFAVLRPVVVPVLLGNLDGRCFGVRVCGVLYAVLREEVKHLLLTRFNFLCHSALS
jgi:hypothetical protein